MKTSSLLRTLIRPLFRFLLRRPKFLLLVPIAFGVWYAYETQVARPNMAYMGVPKVEMALPGSGFSHILRYDGFMLEYSEGLKNPLWVTYKVTEQKYKSGKRPSRFSREWLTLSRVTHEDYTGSGYDRGHMAPNYVIASRYGRSAQQDTFTMTNITPQAPKLNQKSWQRLEEVIANDFSEKYGDFWVVTGPIFADQPKRIQKSNVAIPDAFYKILIRPGTNEQPANALAFIFPQNAKPNASLMRFVVSVDEVEDRTGIDFFADLDDGFENLLESSKTPDAWNLRAVANRPSRY
ncbi:DNA/RNA non-specific endonuclease [Thiomicrorhabdus xiamenensis]|uniref:DNA/RNA non-specific endonuclease n=1 Tax=Thiomicrorhabdus xiamenensis TaxID=2739063 RepID=A0A7D4SHE3_9GAMM|nr:DNA/RNA non-specific endonuclease [Thiomicrorhabdus xiamenensis]QKI88140.1 DNA/RNA non-specific endonuclease [Thiomicrorhabdus xiamenensis]